MSQYSDVHLYYNSHKENKEINKQTKNDLTPYLFVFDHTVALLVISLTMDADKAISLLVDSKLKASRLEEENGLLKAELETRKEEVSQ